MNSTNVYITTINISGLKKVPKYQKKCEHDRRCSRCKECKGGAICGHNRQRSRCKECKGGAICEHNRIRSRCKECKGGSICEHNKNRSSCKECKGGSICDHNRRRNQCKQCGGSSICEHGKMRFTCIMCSKHPLLECTFPLCDYKTKIKQHYNKHVKIHCSDRIKNKKLEEVKIEKLLINNEIDYTREHTVSFSCV